MSSTNLTQPKSPTSRKVMKLGVLSVPLISATVCAAATAAAVAMPAWALGQEPRAGTCQCQACCSATESPSAPSLQVRTLPCADLTADVFLSLFEPEYYRSLPTSEQELLRGADLDDLPSIRTSNGKLPGAGLGAWMGTSGSKNGIETLEPHFTFAPMSNGDHTAHVRLVVYNTETGQVICNEVYEGSEYLEISRALTVHDSVQAYSAIVLGYVTDGETNGVPVFRMLTPEM